MEFNPKVSLYQTKILLSLHIARNGNNYLPVSSFQGWEYKLDNSGILHEENSWKSRMTAFKRQVKDGGGGGSQNQTRDEL